MTFLQKTALAVAGVTAFGIGLFILLAPHAFYASYGIALGPDPSLLSELRAPGAGLAGIGAVMLAGLVRPVLRQAAVVAALTVFLAFPAGRVLGILADGAPSGGILVALVLELAIAALCLVAFRRGTGPAVSAIAAR
ncbi:DUF4345 domain-containing protein [Jannaschia seohaensis]|uniref:Uncharacterized protein DUF4345 n=1 Tax=Jannaschia seohaensis TaxID=475081 RepID=A0A2Y9AJA5_9RHOB|nr:DUF4345 domain-containing protein [Jannaschia seohaensis]PWJ20344.1 uncharacterized protein DUF4345 [Jannaschia seohaensis]SSA44390.1 protein of unknown function [Jannaschia seohaensis]